MVDVSSVNFEFCTSEPSEAWIENVTTDFVLHGPAFYRWDWTKRQSLRSACGGQLSQFTWYVHYHDAAGEHRAGVPVKKCGIGFQPVMFSSGFDRLEAYFTTFFHSLGLPHFDNGSPENVRVVEPMRNLSQTEAMGVVETADGKLRLRVRTVMGDGPGVAVEFLITNLGTEPLSELRLTTYANIESAHDEANDFSFLDARTGGLLVYDPPTGTCVVMDGLRPPVKGYSGTWNSFVKLQNASGVPCDEWKPFTGPTPKLAARFAVECAATRGIYLPALTLRPGHNVFKEPYLTLVGSAGWYNPVPDKGQPGYGIAGAIPHTDRLCLSRRHLPPHNG
jgi:hypothetical protein